MASGDDKPWFRIGPDGTLRRTVFKFVLFLVFANIATMLVRMCFIAEEVEKPAEDDLPRDGIHFIGRQWWKLPIHSIRLIQIFFYLIAALMFLGIVGSCANSTCMTKAYEDSPSGVLDGMWRIPPFSLFGGDNQQKTRDPENTIEFL